MSKKIGYILISAKEPDSLDIGLYKTEQAARLAYIRFLANQ